MGSSNDSLLDSNDSLLDCQQAKKNTKKARTPVHFLYFNILLYIFYTFQP